MRRLTVFLIRSGFFIPMVLLILFFLDIFFPFPRPPASENPWDFWIGIWDAEYFVIRPALFLLAFIMVTVVVILLHAWQENGFRASLKEVWQETKSKGVLETALEEVNSLLD